MAGLLNNILIALTVRARSTSLNRTSRDINRTTGSLVKLLGVGRALRYMSGGLIGGGLIYGAQRMFSSYLQFEKDLGAMKSRFYAITHDEKQSIDEFNYIKNVALRTANDVKASADSYSIFYASARRALGQEGARGVFTQWMEISRVLHLDEEAMGRVTYALREMSSKGQLYSQDLKMQLGTHVPDAVNIATEAIKNMNIAGVDSIEKFQKLTKSQPNAGWMGKFLIEFSKVAHGRYATPDALKKAMSQPDALAKQISNMSFQYNEAFSRYGGNKAMTSILGSTYRFLKSIPMEGIAKGMSLIYKVFAKTYDILIDNFATITKLLISIATYLAFKSIAGAWKGGWKQASGFLGAGAKAGDIVGMMWWASPLRTFLLNIVKILTKWSPWVAGIMTLISIVGWIWGKVQDKKDTNKQATNFKKSFMALGYDEKAYNRFLGLTKELKGSDPEVIEEALKHYGYGKVAEKMSFEDNGNYSINFGSVTIESADDFSKMYDIARKAQELEQQKNNNPKPKYSQKPRKLYVTKAGDKLYI